MERKKNLRGTGRAATESNQILTRAHTHTQIHTTPVEFYRWRRQRRRLRNKNHKGNPFDDELSNACKYNAYAYVRIYDVYGLTGNKSFFPYFFFFFFMTEVMSKQEEQIFRSLRSGMESREKERFSNVLFLIIADDATRWKRAHNLSPRSRRSINTRPFITYDALHALVDTVGVSA
jgi:hypothetical protein